MSTVTHGSSSSGGGGGMIMGIVALLIIIFLISQMVTAPPVEPGYDMNIEMGKGGNQNHRETQFDWIQNEHQYRQAKGQITDPAQVRKLKKHGKAKGWENKQKRSSN